MDIARVIANTFLEAHPLDAVRILERSPVEDAAALLDAAPPALAAQALHRMDLVGATRCLGHMHPSKAGALLEHSAVEEAALLLRHLDDPRRAAILAETPSAVEERLRRVLRYPQDTAGALMDPGVFTFLDELTVEAALDAMREHAQALARYLYVVTREKRLVGVLTLRDLFLASPTVPVASVMQADVEKLAASTDLRAVLVHPGWLAYHALPVVENGDLFVGALRYKTLRRLEQERGDTRQAGAIGTAGKALGELYQIGLSGLVRSAISLTEVDADT